MGEDFICYDGGIVLYVDFFDCQGGDFGEEDAAEGVGDGGIDADEGECGLILLVLVEDDLEILLELLERPGIVFARMVAGEVGRGDIGDGFGVDAY